MEPMLADLDYETRIFYWLAEVFRKESLEQNDMSLLKKSASFSVKTQEGGYNFGFLDAGVTLLRSGGKELEKEGVSYLVEAAKLQSEHAAGLLFNYYSELYRITADEKMKETYLDLSQKYMKEAKALDKGLTWRDMTVDQLIKNGSAKVLKSNKK